VDNIEYLEKRYDDRRLVVWRRRQRKKRTQGSSGFRKNLDAAQVKIIQRAVPSLRKGRFRKRPGRDSLVRGMTKGGTLVKKRDNGRD
jgi:hypothetical protein